MTIAASHHLFLYPSTLLLCILVAEPLASVAVPQFPHPPPTKAVVYLHWATSLLSWTILLLILSDNSHNNLPYFSALEAPPFRTIQLSITWNQTLCRCPHPWTDNWYHPFLDSSQYYHALHFSTAYHTPSDFSILTNCTPTHYIYSFLKLY